MSVFAKGFTFLGGHYLVSVCVCVCLRTQWEENFRSNLEAIFWAADFFLLIFNFNYPD